MLGLDSPSVIRRRYCSTRVNSNKKETVKDAARFTVEYFKQTMIHHKKKIFSKRQRCLAQLEANLEKVLSNEVKRSKFVVNGSKSVNYPPTISRLEFLLP